MVHRTNARNLSNLGTQFVFFTAISSISTSVLLPAIAAT
jgi:hypothetical protein